MEYLSNEEQTDDRCSDDIMIIRSTALRVETAAGKTRIALEWAAGMVRNGSRVVVAVPRHNLADELVERFATLGVNACAFRGYEADDPNEVGSEYQGDDQDQVEEEKDCPGTRRTKMCRQRSAYRDASRARLPVKSSVCKSKRKIRGEWVEARCVLADECGMMRQAQEDPQVWIVPHALLFQEKPTYIPKPDVVIIDERFFGAALPQSAVSLTLDCLASYAKTAIVFEHDRAGLANTAESKKLRHHAANLVASLRAQSEDGWLSRSTLEYHGITLEVAGEALKQQWRCLDKPDIFPGMPPRKRKELADAAEKVNREVLKLCGLWEEIRNLLGSDHANSGRMRLEHDEATGARCIKRNSLKTVRSGWQTDCLILDATLPDQAILEAVLDHPVDIEADIAVSWSRHGHTRQILFAPVSASRLGIAGYRDKGKPDRRIVTELLGFIALRAALAFAEFRADHRRVVAVVGQKKLIEKLRAAGLPPNIETGHFGGLSGLDKWKWAAGMIVIGRPLPGPEIVEAQAGIIAGKPPIELTPNEHGITWYPKVEGAIRLSDGSGIAVQMDRHPDPVAEALRWQHCEAELIQAIGRLRLLRRNANSPYFIDIISDVVLPISVDSVVAWEEANPGPCTRLARYGVILESATDISRGFPELAVTPKAAEPLRKVDRLSSCFRTVYGFEPELRRLDYLLQGTGRKPVQGIVLPNAPDNLRGELEQRLGPMARFEVTFPRRLSS